MNNKWKKNHNTNSCSRDIVVNGGSVSVSIPSNENKDSTDKDDDVFYDSEDETEDQSDTFAWVQICNIIEWW